MVPRDNQTYWSYTFYPKTAIDFTNEHFINCVFVSFEQWFRINYHLQCKVAFNMQLALSFTFHLKRNNSNQPEWLKTNGKKVPVRALHWFLIPKCVNNAIGAEDIVSYHYKVTWNELFRRLFTDCYYLRENTNNHDDDFIFISPLAFFVHFYSVFFVVVQYYIMHLVCSNLCETNMYCLETKAYGIVITKVLQIGNKQWAAAFCISIHIFDFICFNARSY